MLRHDLVSVIVRRVDKIGLRGYGCVIVDFGDGLFSCLETASACLKDVSLSISCTDLVTAPALY